MSNDWYNGFNPREDDWYFWTFIAPKINPVIRVEILSSIVASLSRAQTADISSRPPPFPWMANLLEGVAMMQVGPLLEDQEMADQLQRAAAEKIRESAAAIG